MDKGNNPIVNHHTTKVISNKEQKRDMENISSIQNNIIKDNSITT